MRTVAIIFSIVFICVFSCTKSGVNIRKNDLAGSWKLVRITGGLAGIDSVPKENVAINFETSGKHNTTLENAVTGEGTYTLTNAGDRNYYFSSTLINLFADNGNQFTYGIILQNDSLFLDEGCCDQFSSTYTKQK